MEPIWCKNCGQLFEEGDAVYSKCGKLNPLNEWCQNCGHLIELGEKFCVNCGKKRPTTQSI